jgi:hypothetical protein
MVLSVLLFGCAIVSHLRYPQEQAVLDKWVSLVSQDRCEEAKALCFRAVVYQEQGHTLLDLQATKPHPDPFNKQRIIEHPDSWNSIGVKSVAGWSLMSKDESVSPSDHMYDPPPGCYVLMTDTAIAVGYVRINGQPKICFMHAMHG